MSLTGGGEREAGRDRGVGERDEGRSRSKGAGAATERTGLARATATRATGEAEAAATAAKLAAEADGIERRAAALEKNNEAVIAQTLAEQAPELVRAAAESFRGIDQQPDRPERRRASAGWPAR